MKKCTCNALYPLKRREWPAKLYKISKIRAKILQFVINYKLLNKVLQYIRYLIPNKKDNMYSFLIYKYKLIYFIKNFIINSKMGRVFYL